MGASCKCTIHYAINVPTTIAYTVVSRAEARKIDSVRHQRGAPCQTPSAYITWFMSEDHLSPGDCAALAAATSLSPASPHSTSRELS